MQKIYKRGPRLDRIGDVSKFLSRVIRETYTGKLDHQLAAKLGYLCNVLKSLLEAGALEDRLDSLEKAVEDWRKE